MKKEIPCAFLEFLEILRSEKDILLPPIAWWIVTDEEALCYPNGSSQTFLRVLEPAKSTLFERPETLLGVS